MKIEAPKGMSIYNAVAWAKLQAVSEGLREITLVFNEISLTIDRSSLDIDICTIYQLECRVRNLK